MAAVEFSAQPSKRHLGSKSGLVHDALRADIIALRLEPGAQIDKTAMCRQFGVSRQPLSEALARLAEERLVSVEPQKGTYVTRIHMRDVVEAAFLREALEVAIVRRIAPDLDDETLQRLNLLVSYQSAALAAGDLDESYGLDVRFHNALTARLDYGRVGAVIESARAQTERIRRLLLSGRDSRTIDEHKRIVEALATRDPDRAARAMHEHLANVLDALHDFAAQHPELFEP